MARNTLQKGSRGEDVKELQTFLNNNGYSLSVDGDFGSNTDAAVRDYQTKNNISADGIVGDKTWGALTGVASKAPSFTYDDFDFGKAKPNDFTYGDFNYSTAKPSAPTTGPYTPSDAVTKAEAALNAQLAQKPGEYKSQWQTQLDDAINKILNREEFSYDLNGDALYQQYKDKYIQQGKMAMGDAVGQASAMTGGYGNSWAQSVGQQAYNAELQNLNDIVPELYNMALDKYNAEGDNLYKQYAMLGERENMDYGRYRDSVADFMTERDYLQGRYDSERGFDYSKFADERGFEYGKYRDEVNDWQNDRNFAYSQYTNDKNFAYNQHRDSVADWQNDRSFEYGKYADDKAYAYKNYENDIAYDQWLAEFNEAQRQYDESMAFNREQYEYSKNPSGGSSGSSGGSSGSSDSGNKSNTSNTGNTSGAETTPTVPAAVTDAVKGATTNQQKADILAGYVNDGVIDADQAARLLADHGNVTKDLKDRTWTQVDDGGINWFGGVDNNAKVKDQYGNTYRLDDLVDALVKEGMTKKEAKEFVKQFN
jgi:peptidoglycan hydrolase-like protein with peptidoglycan-binding domain